MLTKEQILEAVKAGRESQCCDSRDYNRLCSFFPDADLEAFGYKVKDGLTEPRVPIEFTQTNVLAHLKHDVAFGFEKALHKRGISASSMHEVVKMWLWVLEDSRHDSIDYAQYGLPLFKAVALAYGFPNPIGEDAGNEHKYSAEADY